MPARRLWDQKASKISFKNGTKTLNIFKTIELYTLNGQVVWYVNKAFFKGTERKRWVKAHAVVYVIFVNIIT